MNAVFIPSALKSRAQWLCWKLEDRGGPKPTKTPYCVKSGCLGKSNDPATWCDFNTALAALRNGKGYDGIGFAFHECDGLTGIDVDYSWGSPIASAIREKFQGTYCERSPSEKLRIFCYGKPGRCGKGTMDKAIEIYDHTSPRYLTVTGQWIEGTTRDVTEQQAALDWLHERYFKPKEEPKPKKPKNRGPELSLGDQEIIDKARAARNGAKFSTLFYGGWEAEGYPSQSEADAALCSMIAFWTQDERQIDRIFRQSALMRPKWDKRHHADGRTYGQATIERALGAVAETYRPGDHREEPSPWEDPPVEAYTDDPYAQGQGPKGAETGHAAETILDIGKAVLSFEDLLKTEIPERKRLLPWLPEGGLCMVYSPRGLGKTFFGLSLAHSLTSGTPFMKWEDVFCVGVLYIDGEMPLGETRERLQGFIFKQPEAPLEVLSHEMFYRQFEKDLVVTDPDVQHALLELLDAKKELHVAFWTT